MAQNFKTSQLSVRDQHGHQHVIIKTTEVLQVTFENGSTGARAGTAKYVLIGREVVRLDDGTFVCGNLKMEPV